MNAGNLDRRITIQTPRDVMDGDGGLFEDWIDLAEVWAQVLPLRGRELFVAQQVNSTIDTKFIIRYRDDVTERCQIVYESREYDIYSVVELGRHEGLEILASGVLRDD